MSQLQIKASVKLQQRIRKVHLTVRQMVFADLLAIGYEPRDAYQIAGIYDTILSPAENWKNMRSLMETNEAFNNYIPLYVENSNKDAIKTPTKKKCTEVRQDDVDVPENPIPASPITQHQISDAEMAEMLSKENQLKDLLWKLKYGNLDDKTEMDVRKMIADLTNAKKEQTQAEEKKTIFYLPLKCNQCDLYIKAQKNKKG